MPVEIIIIWLMSGRLNDIPKNVSEDASNDIALHIPGMDVDTLINMIAVAKRVFCDGEFGNDFSSRRAVHDMEQLVYRQSYDQAGADEVWLNPMDGSFHHPTFPEQQGEAWEVMKCYDDEVFTMRLIEIVSRILASRDSESGQMFTERHDHYEHLLQAIVEAEGPDGVIRHLIS